MEKWTTDTTDSKIVAMQAKARKELTALRTEVATIKKKYKEIEKKGPFKKRGDTKKTGFRSPKNKPSWYNHKPSGNNINKTREWNNRKWYFCSPETGGKCDGKWRCHKPSECNPKVFLQKKKQQAEEKGNSRLALKLEQKLAALQATVINESDDESM